MNNESNLDEVMKESFCTCGLPWSEQQWGNLGTVRLCTHGQIPKITASSGASPWDTNTTGASPYIGSGVSTLSSGVDEIGRALTNAGFLDVFSNRIIYDLGFRNGQKENIPYQACLNREKQFVDNTKNAAENLRNIVNYVYRSLVINGKCKMCNKDPERRTDCADCRCYSQLMQIIGKMERYEYGKTN